LTAAGKGSQFACEDTEELGDGANWRRVVLRKISKLKWEIIDESGVEVYETITTTEDKGPVAEWGMYYRSPTEESIEAAANTTTAEQKKQMEVDKEIMESPNRKRTRQAAFTSLQKQGRAMKKKAKQSEGPVDVGTIVQVPLDDVDRDRVDNPTLTLVVLELVKVTRRTMYRLGCKVGPMQNLYARSYIRPVPRMTPKALSLDNVLANYKSMPTCTERKAARIVSPTGGQGMISCQCKGKCDTKRCKCKAAGRICNSRCHKGNGKCCNHD